jgi:hypothetical protein
LRCSMKLKTQIVMLTTAANAVRNLQLFHPETDAEREVLAQIDREIEQLAETFISDDDE